MILKLSSCLLVTGLLLAGVQFQLQAQLVVNNANDSGIGSLRQAIADSSPGGTITFASGLSGATIVLTTGELQVGKNLTIDASALADRVQISGNTNSRIFNVTNCAVVMNSLTIRDGYIPLVYGQLYPNNAGGGILINQGTLTISNCLIVNNQAVQGTLASGGGILNFFGTLTIHNSTISSNATIYYGGGIENDSGTLTIYNSLISSNTAGIFGGGIDSYYGVVTINNSTLAGNSADTGGGGIENLGTLTLNQCTLTANSCSGSGGAAVDISNGEVTINQSTLSGNAASDPDGVGGIWGDATISNTIVAGNTAPTYSNLYGTITATGVNLTNGAPLLAPLGDYGGPTPTMMLISGSPAIDGCTMGTGFTTDQRGFPRVTGAYADIGAVEGFLNYNPVFFLTDVTKLGNGSIQFGFTNVSGLIFTVLATTNIAAPVNAWSNLGSPVESPPGRYQFTDSQAPNFPRRFYRVLLP